MPEHPGFELREIQDRAKVRLRVRMDGADAACDALPLPRQAMLAQGDDPAACWLGPDQWLLTSDSKTSEEIISHIGDALRGQLHAATDLSSGNACFALTGTAARTVLAMGCGIDLHPRQFAAGQCVRTHFANIALLIVARADDQFDLYLDRSQAAYLCDWFAAAGEDPLTLPSGTSRTHGEPE